MADLLHELRANGCPSATCCIRLSQGQTDRGLHLHVLEPEPPDPLSEFPLLHPGSGFVNFCKFE